MDNSEFRQDVINMIKKDQKDKKKGKMSPEQIRDLDTEIFPYIDTLYGENEENGVFEIEQNKKQDGSKHPPRNFKHRLSQIFDNFFNEEIGSYIAIASLCLVLIGAAVVFESKITLLPEAPGSLVAQGLGVHADPLVEESKSFGRQTPSERRIAFLTGVTQSGVDLIDDSNSPFTHKLVGAYSLYVTGNDTSDANVALNELSQAITQYASDDDTKIWLRTGYALEVVNLAARGALVDPDKTVVNDALGFYRQETSGLSEWYGSQDIAKRFLSNHSLLLSAADNEPKTMTQTEIQGVIDMIFQMKVVVD